MACFTGKAEGILFEDAGDGYAFTQGDYLLTYYSAELHSSVVTVKVFKSEGSWRRPKRNLKINILLGGGAMVCLLPFILFLSLKKQNIFIIITKQLVFIQVSADGVDGGEIHLTMHSESQVSSLVATSELEHKKRLGIYLTTFLWFYCFRSTNK